MRKKLDFNPKMHGWHFRNNISTDLKGALRTYGLCGGMCLSALNYWRHKIKIPSLNWEDIPGDSKFFRDGKEWINVPIDMPGRAHPVFDFIFHSQVATYQTPNLVKQVVFFTHDYDNLHHQWSIQDEFPAVKACIDNNKFVMIALRNAKKGDLIGHQCLVYGYDDDRKTLFVYDPNHPDVETIIFSTGTKLEVGEFDTSGNYAIYGANEQYRSYYFLHEYIADITSVDTTYDFIRNIRDNFSVKPPYIEPALVSNAGMINPLAETVIARAVRSRPR